MTSSKELKPTYAKPFQTILLLFLWLSAQSLPASEVYPLDKSEIASIPTSHKEELHKLPPEQQAEVLKQAEALAQTEGKPREARHIAFVVKEYKSVIAETEAKGQALGLPTRGDSTLPESGRIDELTHSSPADVDDIIQVYLVEN